MISFDFISKSIVITVIICVCAYFVPGLVLRAIRDFKKRYGKGEENG